MNTNTHTVQEAPWTYTRTETWGTYTAKNADTGDEFDTGQTTMPDVRRVMFERAQRIRRERAASGQPVITYTIESGPQRARAGHQRHRYRNGEPVIPDAQSALPPGR